MSATILNYNPGKLTIKYFSKEDQGHIDYNYPIFVLCFNNLTNLMWSELPYGTILQQRWQNERSHQQTKSDNLKTFQSHLPNDAGTPISIINLGAYDSTFKQLEVLRNQIVHLTKYKPKIVNVIVSHDNTSNNFDYKLEEQAINNFILCTGSHYTLLPKISKKAESSENSELTIICRGAKQTYDHTRIQTEIHANGLTRYLCNLPANHLYPEVYRNYVEKLAKQYNWQYEFFDHKVLAQKQAGAYLAVIQGSSKKDAGIIHLSYKPKNACTKKIALVGKGLCFDTGGHNLKTHPGSMYGMQHDMTGSAVALGTFLALTELKVPFQVDAYLALAQNDIGPDAYKPADVVFASNGMSIEVINTDAEGRMVLADTLHLASLEKPDVIIDYATLTGSCVRALDELYSGLFTNQEKWNSPLIDIGQQCGERVWPFPYTEDYDEVLKSDIADIKQCHEGSADHIRAARFLGKFLHDDTPWIHIDLSSNGKKGGLGHIHTETTGFGVRFTLSCLLDSSLLI